MYASCKSVKAGLLALLLGYGMQARALEYLDGDVQVHGFLSQGIVFTSDNNFLGDSEDGSLDFREAGVNLSWRPHPDWQFSGQLLSHRAGESDDGDVRVDYALVDWTVLSSEKMSGGLRLGRIKNPYGLYNKTRDVAFTRPSIVLPQSIYTERTRNLTMAADGVGLYWEYYGTRGNLEISATAGMLDVSEKSSEVALLGRDWAGKLSSDTSYIVRALYEGNGGRYLLGITSAFANAHYRPASVDVLQAGEIDFDPIILSGQYNADCWSITGEYALRKSRYQDFGAFPDTDTTGLSYYLQGQYKFTPQWEGLLRYDVMYVDRDDHDGNEYEAATGRPSFTRYAKDWTLGLRYDVTPAFMLRAEYHNVDGTAWLPGLDNPDLSGQERRWDMFMLLGSFRF